MNLLITEDMPAMADMLEITAESLYPTGITIRKALSLQEARNIISTGFIPDVVISDHDLPDGKGPSLFNLYKETNTHVYICLMSSKIPALSGEHIFIHKSEIRQRLGDVLNQVYKAA